MFKIVAFGIVTALIGLAAFSYDRFGEQIENRHRSDMVRLAFDKLAKSAPHKGEQSEMCFGRVRLNEVEICSSVNALKERKTGFSCVPTVVFSSVVRWSNSVDSDRIVVFSTFSQDTVRSILSEIDASPPDTGPKRLYRQASQLIGTFSDVKHFACEGYNAVLLEN